MKTSARRSTFVVSLTLGIIVFGCLALVLAGSVRHRPARQASAKSKVAAAQHARAKRPAKPAPRAAAPEQTQLSTPPPVVRRP